jgi:hypothetical protein
VAQARDQGEGSVPQGQGDAQARDGEMLVGVVAGYGSIQVEPSKDNRSMVGRNAEHLQYDVFFVLSAGGCRWTHSRPEQFSLDACQFHDFTGTFRRHEESPCRDSSN